MDAIENYGLIGNQRSCALISRSGSIDFFCPRGFDRPSVFSRLLDKEAGHFSISPENVDPDNSLTYYFPDSCVLITRFRQNGVSEIWDFMPLAKNLGKRPIARKVKGVKGTSKLRFQFCPRFNYARDRHEVEKIEGGYAFRTRDECLYLYSTCEDEMTLKESDLDFQFSLQAKSVCYFLLTERPLKEQELKNLSHTIEQDLEHTIDECRSWIAQSRYHGRWEEEVNRSALTLKMLISEEHGAQVAAPTFSLPESPGGPNNWDYRYAWIRDNCLTFLQFLKLGFKQEATDFLDWLRPILEKSPDSEPLPPVFTLRRDRKVTEETLKHFSGYENSKPVRIGNAAWEQLQTDIYGELMEFFNSYDKNVEFLSHRDLEMIKHHLDWLADNWHCPDRGIWERRDQSNHHLYSYVLSWVAFDRAIRLFKRRSAPAPLDKWYTVRDEIYRSVHNNFWCEELQCFVHVRGGQRIDASALIMPLSRFCSPQDPRWRSTLDQIQHRLMEDNFIHRYSEGLHPSGFRGDEGTFSLATFWYAECLVKGHYPKRGRYIFERMLSFSLPLGLFSEEVGIDGHQLGNFPQALTHSALISCALAIDGNLSQSKSEVGYEYSQAKRKNGDRYWSFSGGGSSPGERTL